VRFLERRGRYAEAEAAVRRFEDSAGVAAPTGPEPAAAPAAAPGSVTARPGARPRGPSAQRPLGPAALWAPGLRGSTAALWVVWFGVNFAYYGAFIWIPSLLVAGGMDLVRSFGFTLVITLAQLPGYAAAAVLVERWGRRATLSTFLVGSAVSAVLFGRAESETSILLAGMALSFFNLGAWGALYALSPEVYPTELRGTGTGWAAGFGRIASVLAPLSVPYLLDVGAGEALLFAVFAACFAVAAAASWALPERRGEALTETLTQTVTRTAIESPEGSPTRPLDGRR
jgi:putative MFS transporter